MIIYKSPREIDAIRESCRIAAEALRRTVALVRPNLATRELEKVATEYIRSCGADLSFKGYRGFPGNICVSINEEVVHGIPGPRLLKEGDIVSIDIGAYYKRYHGDLAVTLPVGKPSAEAEKLIAVCREALEIAISMVVPGRKLFDISREIQRYAQFHGYSVVRQFVGHGIGMSMHEDPQVPNFAEPGMERYNAVLKPGMVFTFEPMFTLGSGAVKIDSKNKWTVYTKDRRLSAHFEHTVAVTNNGVEVLSRI